MKHQSLVLLAFAVVLVVGCGGQKPAPAPKPDSTAACCDSATLAKCQSGGGCDSAMLAKCHGDSGVCDSANMARCHGDSAGKTCGTCPSKTQEPAKPVQTGR